MKVISILVLSLILLVVSSCAKQISTTSDPCKNPFIVIANKILLEQFEKDKKAYDKRVELWVARVRVWKEKENDFLKNLFNEELQAYAGFKETYKQGNAKHLLAYRKFEKLLLESAEFKKLTAFKRLCKEEGELTKEGEILDAKFHELEKSRNQLVRIASWMEKEHLKAEEDRRYQEMMSEIRSANFWNWHYQNQSLFQQQMMNQQLWMLQNNPGIR